MGRGQRRTRERRSMDLTGRGERVRTSDLSVPNAARYQTALRPESSYYIGFNFWGKNCKLYSYEILRCYHGRCCGWPLPGHGNKNLPGNCAYSQPGHHGNRRADLAWRRPFRQAWSQAAPAPACQCWAMTRGFITAAGAPLKPAAWACPSGPRTWFSAATWWPSGMKRCGATAPGYISTRRSRSDYTNPQRETGQRKNQILYRPEFPAYTAHYRRTEDTLKLNAPRHMILRISRLKIICPQGPGQPAS